MNSQYLRYFVLATVLILSTGNSFSMETENKQSAKPHSSADLLFNVRTNINSAAIVAGTWALRNLVYFSAYNFYHNHFRYWSTFDAVRYSFGTGIETALPVALLAVGLWGVDKFLLREKHYESLAQTNSQEQSNEQIA